MALPKKPERAPAEEVLTAYAGVRLLVRAARSLGLAGSVKRHLHLKQRQRGWDEATAGAGTSQTHEIEAMCLAWKFDKPHSAARFSGLDGASPRPVVMPDLISRLQEKV
jgi:hypothetical protein